MVSEISTQMLSLCQNASWQSASKDRGAAMKVALMTFFVGQNYGALLQAWALWQMLSSLGCDVEFVDFHHPWSKMPNWWSWRSYASRSLVGVCRRIKAIQHHLRLRRQFGKMEKIFPRTTIHYGANPTRLDASPPIADAYVVGSDQVWRVVAEAYRFIRPYFLSFGSDAVKRIAYAASLGGCNFDDSLRNDITRLLCQFSAISVREEAGARYLAQLLEQAVDVVPDPTLALGATCFDKLRMMASHVPDGRDVYYIMDGMPLDTVNCLRGMVGDKSYNVALQGFRLSGSHNFIPEVPEFVDVIAKSKSVVTNSFHACVFSILYHRPFVYIPFDGSNAPRNERIDQLLSDFGLRSQRVDVVQAAQIHKQLMNAIDWQYVDTVLANMHVKAVSWLEKALGI